MSKALEASLVVLFIGLLATALYGGFVPDHRRDAADAVAHRAATDAANALEDAVPATATSLSVKRRVDLPDRIRGNSYTIAVANRTLDLRAPRTSVRVPLVLPARVRSITGTWHSTHALRLRVTGNRTSIHVRLTEAD